MATDYPGAIDTTKLTNPNTTDKTNSPSHAGLHANANDAIKAAETKLGTGSTTPASNTLLFGTGAGTSAWQTLTSANLAALLTDETGTGSNVFATTPTLVTPKVDTINESTPGNGTTIGSVNIKSGALNTNNSVVTANITNAAVTANKLATGAARALVATTETTTSTSYADLTTTSDSVTVTVGANALALVTIDVDIANSTANSFNYVSVVVSGTSTVAASDQNAIKYQVYAANASDKLGIAFILTSVDGLAAGSSTFKLKYKVATGGGGAGTGTFLNRRISVVPL